MKLPTLYTVDSMSRPREWTVEVEGRRYRTTEGLVGGTLTTSQWTEAQATNVGKKSERTPEQQAVFEAQAKWRKKRDLGAAENIADAGAQFHEPMLAKKWGDVPYFDGCLVMVQPKLDGHRCLIYLRDGKPYAQSRKGKAILSVEHILDALVPLFAAAPNVVLDGELYNHSMRSNFSELSGLIRRTKLTAQDKARCREVLQFHAYDCWLLGAEDTPFYKRGTLLTRLCEEYVPNNCTRLVQLVATYAAADTGHIERLEECGIDDGYEGVMVRRASAPYTHGRTADLLKLKRFEDEEFELVNLEEGVGNRSGLATVARVRDPKTGAVSGVGVMGQDAFVRDLLKRREEFIGRMVTVKFQGRTPDGLLRFGKMKSFHAEAY